MGLARIEKDRDGQLPFFFVKLQEQAIKPAIQIPIQIAEVIARRVVAVIGNSTDCPRAAAALTLGGAFRAAFRQELELFEAPQEFRGRREFMLKQGVVMGSIIKLSSVMASIRKAIKSRPSSGSVRTPSQHHRHHRQRDQLTCQNRPVSGSPRFSLVLKYS